MIAGVKTDEKTGAPVINGEALSQSLYNPPKCIKDLFSQVQKDYLNALALQNRPFNEFDQLSLLQRANLDQQTFGAFVGATFLPATQSWRWRGRKNTARNKIIGLLAHLLSVMIFPYVYAYDENNKNAVMEAKVMRMLIEHHLKKAGYEHKYLFMLLGALVQPAAFVEIEYVEAFQKVKMKKGGKWEIKDVVDTFLSGIGMHMVPIDSLMLGDFYTYEIQNQPYIARVRRISYDAAQKIYKGKYKIDGKDQFDYVIAGQTNFFMNGANNQQMIYSVGLTQAEENMVQEVTLFYKGEDLEVTFVNGVFMGNYENDDVYMCNPFKHRRVSVIGDDFVTIPVYPFAKVGFEPIDPNGRFAYYKSAAFKEYWDDASFNRAYQLLQDGTFLDVIKPVFGSGVASINSDAIVPGNFIGLPQGAQIMPYSLGPNLGAALNLLRQNDNDMSLSTQDNQQSGIATAGVTATASIQANQNAKIILSVFSSMIADMVKDIGELTIDNILLHTTIGQFNAQTGDLAPNYQMVKMQQKENGKNVNKIIEFKTDMMGDNFNEEKANELEWKMFVENGGLNADTHIYYVNPYNFAKVQFNLIVDPTQIVSRAMGTDQQRKMQAFQLLSSPLVAPYIDMEAVVDKFILDEYSDGNPDQFKRKTPMPGIPPMGQGGEIPPPEKVNLENSPGVGRGSSTQFQSALQKSIPKIP